MFRSINTGALDPEALNPGIMVSKLLGRLENVRDSMQRMCEACIMVNRHIFEHLVWFLTNFASIL